MAAAHNGIVLFHYPFSPYARRITWYLALRGIDYAQCLQPPILPRPDLSALGVQYRRIPVLAIGRSVYCDTRLILQKLEALFPSPSSLAPTTPEQKALTRLLEMWAIESGQFAHAAALIPAGLPLLNDPAFKRDRQQFSGGSWEKEERTRARPEAEVVMRDTFTFFESGLLADGRRWILGTEKPSLADIEAVWRLHWLMGMKGALPASIISATQFPKVFAWVRRFDEAVKTAGAAVPKPAIYKGAEAIERILAADYAEAEGGVDGSDPLRLEKGQLVEAWPTDSGFSHKDRGRLVGLSQSEVVMETNAGRGEIRIHYPRSMFRIRALNEARL